MNSTTEKIDNNGHSHASAVIGLAGTRVLIWYQLGFSLWGGAPQKMGVWLGRCEFGPQNRNC